jgi:hypothetical protein
MYLARPSQNNSRSLRWNRKMSLARGCIVQVGFWQGIPKGLALFRVDEGQPGNLT